MPDPGDTETRPRQQLGPRLGSGWRLLRGTGWLVFFLVVASISYILLVLAGH